MDNRPEANGSPIRIREVRSLFGSDNTLIVLKGIPFFGGLNGINISLDILKDAFVTVIYSQRYLPDAMEASEAEKEAYQNPGF